MCTPDKEKEKKQIWIAVSDLDVPARSEYIENVLKAMVKSVPPPILAGWEESTDDTTGSKYYFNISTNETRWDRPSAPPKNIFSDGLPELGPLSDTLKFTSNPSVPTEEQHASAQLSMTPFSALSNLTEFPYPKTNIWNQVLDATGTLGGYANEAGVNSKAEMVITDILESMGVREKVTIRTEVEVMNNRPDFMLILFDGHPIGTMESQYSICDPDELRGVENCWLHHQESNKLAATDELPPNISHQIPVKQKPKLLETSEDKNLGHKQPSPTPDRKRGIGSLQIVVDEGEKSDDEIRKFCGTEIMKWDDKTLPVILTSLIRKMMIARQGAEPTVLRLLDEKTSVCSIAKQLELRCVHQPCREELFFSGNFLDTALTVEHS